MVAHIVSQRLILKAHVICLHEIVAMSTECYGCVRVLSVCVSIWECRQSRSCPYMKEQNMIILTAIAMRTSLMWYVWYMTNHKSHFCFVVEISNYRSFTDSEGTFAMDQSMSARRKALTVPFFICTTLPWDQSPCNFFIPCHRINIVKLKKILIVQCGTLYCIYLYFNQRLTFIGDEQKLDELFMLHSYNAECNQMALWFSPRRN